MKSRVVIFITTLDIGGAETVLFRSIQSGCYKNLEVTVVSLKGKGYYGAKLSELGAEVVALNLHRLDLFFMGVLKFFSLFFMRRVVVVHGWLYHANLIAFLFSKTRAKPISCIFSIRHSLGVLEEESRKLRFIIRMNALLSKRVDLIIYNSAVSQGEHEHFGFSSGKSVVLPNGFDVSAFEFSEDNRRHHRSMLAIPDDVVVFGHIGRYHEIKNQYMLVKCFEKTFQQYPHVSLVLVGRDMSRFKSEMKAVCDSDAYHHIHFLDESDSIGEILSAFDVFCLPSRSEGFPNALAEAMSCSLPCISTDCGDSRHIVDDPYWIVDIDNSDAFFSRMQEMIFLSERHRRSIGMGNRKKIVNLYQQDVIAGRFRNVISRFL